MENTTPEQPAAIPADINFQIMEGTAVLNDLVLTTQSKSEKRAELQKVVAYFEELKAETAHLPAAALIRKKIDEHIAFYTQLFADKPLSAAVEVVEKLPTDPMEYVVQLAADKMFAGHERVAQIYDVLRNPEHIAERIQEVVARLARFQMHPEMVARNDIPEGWDVLRRVIQRYQVRLTNENGVIMLKGSMIYNDPVNLDFDVASLIFSELDLQQQEKHIEHAHEASLKLNKVWPFGKGGMIVPVSIPRFYAEVRQMTKLEFPLHLIDIVFRETTDVLSILTGIPIYSELENELQLYQQQLLQVAQENPLFGAFCIDLLQATERVRKKRRGLP